MPRPSKFPDLLNQVKDISITNLAGKGHLKPRSFSSGGISWWRGEQRTGRICFLVNTIYPDSYLELEYSYENKPICYRVGLVSVPSNLGKGDVWYFLCPHTNMRCRTLYDADGLFLHRLAMKGRMYYKQIFSKYQRALYTPFIKAFDLEEELDKLDKPYAKTRYRGSPTMRYLRLLKLEKGI